MKILQAMREGLDEDQCKILLQAMTNLRNQFLNI